MSFGDASGVEKGGYGEVGKAEETTCIVRVLENGFWKSPQTDQCIGTR